VFAQQVLQWVADPPGGSPADRLLAYLRLLLLLLLAETTLALLRWRSDPAASLLAALAGLSALALGLAFVRRTRRAAPFLGVAVTAFAGVRFFPNVADHLALLAAALLLAALWNPDRAGEPALALGSLRWMAAILVFSLGLQKVLHGTWFHGEFAAFQLAHGEPVAPLLAWVTPASEIARLSGGDVTRLAGELPAAGDRLFRLEHPLPLVITNLVWFTELVAPAFLLWGRTRAVTAALLVPFLLIAQVGSPDLILSVFLVGSVLLFARGNAVRWTVPACGVAYAYLIGVRLEVLPAWFLFT
jgi:hypothetical protein